MGVADTILAQLGGARFVAMTGARALVAGPDHLQFVLPRGALNGTNKVQIKLTGDDLYTVAVYRFSSRTLATKPTAPAVNGVYADDLRAVFTRLTGLDTSL